MIKFTLFFSSLGLFLADFAQNQTPNLVQEGYYTVGSDTTFTYDLGSSDKDSAIQTLTSYFGQPGNADAGHITWTKIEISGIGENLTIQLLDGITTTQKNGLIYVPFKSEKQKKTALKNLDDSQSRTMVLEFQGGNGQKFTPTPLQRDNIMALLTVILSVIP